jgi:type III pantothenate kinase
MKEILLAVDVGNSQTQVGGFDGENLVFELRIKTEPGRTADEYGASLRQLIGHRYPQPWRAKQAIVCSVVPVATAEMTRMLERWFDVNPLVVGPGLKTGIAVRSSDPSAVGADRIANAVAVRDCYGYPALVVDFGTATTFDYVNAQGAYEGSVIAPSATGGIRALVRQTARLPQIELTWPKQIIGKSTVHAMQSGIMVGQVCMIEGLLARILDEVGPTQHLVATGDAAEFVPYIKPALTFDGHLTLKGLRLLAALNS